MQFLRLVDFTLAAVMLLVLAVPMLVIAALIRLGDGDPALFGQTRVGMKTRTFRILKFRTMRYTPAADQTRALASTSVGDSRITPLGAKLRPAHLDELPQLLNILKGDMSFIGVRPDTPIQESDYTDDYWRQRHSLRPGLSGPAQLLQGKVTLERRIAAEKVWLENPGISAYFRILAKTAAKVFSRSSH